MLPELFVERMRESLGEEFPDFLKSYDRERYQALRLNALKIGRGGVRASEAFTCGENSFAKLSRVEWAENGFYYDSKDQPGKHPYHEAGVYYIQEPSAMLPVEHLKVEPGDVVLDLCAAPGGKSTQIAAKLAGQGFLLCNEIHPARAKILSENVERMGIVNACVTNETPAHLAQLLPTFFNKVLVDAPCSGEGMFRKNEDACGEWSPENVQLCADRQDEILDCAAQMLQPGGRMVYSTCTFAELEDEGSVSRFLQRHPEFTLLTDRRIWPHKDKGEGHYAAVLEKAGELPDYTKRGVYAHTVAKAGIKDLGEYPQFIKEILKTNDTSVMSEAAKAIRKAEQKEGYLYTKFGDNIYIVSSIMPALKGLKVLRPGLHMGSLKKNRFEPSHALALALAPEDVVGVCDLNSKDMTIMSYLKGETFPYEGEKGWYLICVDGYSVGWGKLAGGVMKNHYPKGLRK